MEKVRVYELAKELNTTSKRLMEKLGEVNVVVKNHMSLLEDHELDALYKHIGIIKHDGKKAETEDKKAVPPAAAAQPKPEPKKDTKSAPRIIRTTEIIINSKNEMRDSAQQSRNDFQRNDFQRNDYQRNDFQRGDVRGARNDVRHDFVRSSDANSGLRAGFVRDSRPDYAKDPNKGQRQDQHKPIQNIPVKDAAKPPVQETVKPQSTLRNDAADIHVEVSPQSKIEAVRTESVKEQLTEINAETVAAKKEDITQMHDEPKKLKEPAKAAKEKHEGVKTHQEKPVQTSETVSEEAPVTSNTAAAESESRGEKPQHIEEQQSDKPQSDKPQSDRPQYQSDRPQGDRPQYQGNRSQGDRPQYQGDRSQGDRPQYQGNRSQGDRPQ